MTIRSRTRCGILTAMASVVAGIALPATASAQAPAPTSPEVSISVPEEIRPEHPTPVTVTAADPEGIASIALYANDRLLGTAAAPSATFAFQPTAHNVNKTTLVAIVTDRAGTSTTAIKVILVKWFRAKAFRAETRQQSSQGSLYRVRTGGRLVRPDALPATEGCSNQVRLTYRWKGGSTQTVANVRSRRCSFRSRSVYLPKPGVVRVTVEYLGDGALEYARTSHRFRLR